MLKIIGLTKSYGQVEVLKGIDLEVDKGEIVVVVGPSGGGKTTLLKIVNGLTKCENGTIVIDGEKVCDNGIYSSKSDIKRISRKIGMVFQGFNLFPHMSVIENIIEAPTRVLKINKNDAVSKGRELLSFLGMEDKENNFPYELSGGQLQRVAIARALALEPKLLCFDEPTSALDPALTGEVAKLIRGLSKTGVSMLIITHDMDFAKKVADRVVSVKDGEILNQDIFSEVL